MIEVLKKEKLTMDMLKNIPNNILAEANLSEDYVDDFYLEMQNFIICLIKWKNSEYTLIHGFPGDNASGIIFDKNNAIITYIGEGCDDNHELAKWYCQLEKNEQITETFCL